MPKKRNIYFFVLGVLFVGYLIIQIFKPKEIDWSPDYTGVKKIPFGCYVLKDLLPVTKPGLNLHINYESLPAALDKIPQPSNLLIITESFNPDKAEVSAIIDYLNKGNKALISAINFGKFFVDTFQVATNMSI